MLTIGKCIHRVGIREQKYGNIDRFRFIILMVLENLMELLLVQWLGFYYLFNTTIDRSRNTALMQLILSVGNNY